MGFSDILHDAFSATQTGQRIASAKQNEAEARAKAEARDREFVDFYSDRGAKHVGPGDVVQDDSIEPLTGAVVPNSMLRKANPANIIKHKDAYGETIKFELPSREVQDRKLAETTARRLHDALMANQENEQLQTTQAANRAGAVQGAQTTATLGAQQTAQNTERNTNGLALPEVVAKVLNLPTDQSGRKFLPAELGNLTQAADAVQITQGRVDESKQKVADQQRLAGVQKQQQALQQLSTVQDQGGYDAIRKANPEGTANWPTFYNPGTANSLMRQAIPIDKQLEMGILNLNEHVDPKEIESSIDQVIPPTGDTAKLNQRTKVLVHAALTRPVKQAEALKDARAIIKDASDQLGKTESAVATAKATAPIKISVAAATDQAKTAASGLTEDDLMRTGAQYAITGEMPALGMSSGARTKILHYAQQFARDSGMSPRDLALAKAAFKGDSASLANFQKQRDQIASFEQTATKNLDLFLNAAANIPDTGVPWLNQPLRTLDEKLVGSANLAAVNAARQVANNEIAKVTSGGGLGGVLSDSARKEVANYNPANATFAQTKAVAKVLKQDMENRRLSMDATLAEIRGRIGNAGSGTSVTLPPEARAKLEEGKHTTFANGQTWTLKNGKPEQVP